MRICTSGRISSVPVSNRFLVSYEFYNVKNDKYFLNRQLQRLWRGDGFQYNVPHLQLRIWLLCTQCLYHTQAFLSIAPEFLQWSRAFRHVSQFLPEHTYGSYLLLGQQISIASYCFKVYTQFYDFLWNLKFYSGHQVTVSFIRNPCLNKQPWANLSITNLKL